MNEVIERIKIKSMDLEKLFSEISIKMRSDLEQARVSLDHAGLKGQAVEDKVREFLRQYLPKSLDISTGKLVDSEGTLSKQLDIIISDAQKTPTFYQSGEVRVIPAECVYAVVEVKAYLNKQELNKAFENMKSVKNLTKVAYFRPNGVVRSSSFLYGKDWDCWPTNYFIFAYDSDKLETITLNLHAIQQHEDVHKRIDSICVLNKGVVINEDDNGMYSALPSTTTPAKFFETEKSLLLFYIFISIILNQAKMNPFNPHTYIGKMRF